MKDILITINRETRMVTLSKSTIGNDGESLQAKLIFSFEDEFVDGQARLEYTIGGQSFYTLLKKVGETYELPVLPMLTKVGQIDMQLVITSGTEEELSIFKSKMFYLYCNKSINSLIEEVPEYPEWIDVANAKLDALDKINVSVAKVDNVSTLTITNSDGSTETVEILDGEIGPVGPQGERGIQGPQGEQGVQGIQGPRGETGAIGPQGEQGIQGPKGDTGEKGEKGEKGDAGSVKFVVVTELPSENIDETAIYIKSATNTQEGNKFEEFIYVNNAWESLGVPNVEVDLSNYYTKTEVKQITGELTNLSTEDKTNLVNAINEVASSSGLITTSADFPIYVINDDLGNTFKSKLSVYSDLINTLYKNEVGKTCLLIINNSGGSSDYRHFIGICETPGFGPSQIFYTFNSFEVSKSTSTTQITLAKHLTIWGSWTNDVFTASSSTSYNYGTSYYLNKFLTSSTALTKTNTSEYTPTSDYNPATKKYVDDAITTAITTSLEASY